MSESNTADTSSTEAVAEVEGATPEPIAELGEGGVKALAAEREARKAAEKMSTDLASQLKAFEDRDKTDAQRQTEELEAARAQLAVLTGASTRADVAAGKSVPAALLAGPASGSAEDLATFADALIAFQGQKSTNRLLVPNEGTSPNAQGSSESEFVGSLFGSGD